MEPRPPPGAVSLLCPWGRDEPRSVSGRDGIPEARSTPCFARGIPNRVTSSPVTTQRTLPWHWWHLLGLWSLVVAQPIYEVLRENGDFFVARRASPLDLALFVAVLAILLPGLAALAIRALALVSAPLAGAAHLGAVGLLAAALASQVLARAMTLATGPHVALALVAGALGAGAMRGSPAPAGPFR